MSINRELKIAPGAIVCEDVKLKGNITIGAGTVVHPRASIYANAGPIVIGEFCLIEEQVKLVHKIPLDIIEKMETVPTLYIGNNNIFEVGCTVETSGTIGDNNVFESKCYVSPNVKITSGCTIGAGCQITAQQRLKENTIYYGSECYQREGIDKPPPQTSQLEFLSKILPNYHHIKKPRN